MLEYTKTNEGALVVGALDDFADVGFGVFGGLG
jgi:hypothetical protein